MFRFFKKPHPKMNEVAVNLFSKGLQVAATANLARSVSQVSELKNPKIEPTFTVSPIDNSLSIRFTRP